MRCCRSWTIAANGARRPSRLRTATGSSTRRGRGTLSDARVTPAALFSALQRLAPDAIYTTDSGNGTFLAMEHLRLDRPGRFLAPVDFSCMGYSVPAAIGAALANPGRDVVAFAGDGAFLMTGLELATAVSYGAGVVVCLLRDGELAQIAQFQRTAMADTVNSTVASYDVAGVRADDRRRVRAVFARRGSR